MMDIDNIGAGGEGQGAGGEGQGAGGEGQGAGGEGQGVGGESQSAGGEGQAPALIFKGLSNETIEFYGKNGIKEGTPLDDVAKMHANLQKKVGVDTVALPSDREKIFESEIFKQMGAPDNADGYEVQRPELKNTEYDEGFEKAFLEHSASIGLIPEQVQSVINWFAESQEQGVLLNSEALKEAGEKELRSMKAELGEEGYNGTVSRAQAAGRHFGVSEGVMNMLESETGAAGVIKLFSEIGSGLGEDTLRIAGGAAFGGGRTVETIKAARAKARANPHYGSRKNPAAHKAAVAEVEGLSAELAAAEKG